MKHLGTKLALQIAVVIIVVMALFGIYEVDQRRRQTQQFLEAKEAGAIRQLTLILGEMLFYMNLDSLPNIIQSYLTDAGVLAIRILEGDQLLTFTGKHPETGDIIDLSGDEAMASRYQQSVRLSETIEYEGEELGRVDIIFSRQLVRTQARETAVTLVISLLLVLLVECAALVWLVSRKVTRPLLHLVQAARRIAEGDVNVQLAGVHSRDEIATLSTAFRTMMTYLQEMAAAATRISNGNLRQEIRPRSDKDALGHAFHTMTLYLRDIAGAASAIATGDLRHIIAPKSADDELGTAFQQMTALRESIGNILEGTARLRSASEELDHVSTGMAAEIEQASEQTSIMSSRSQQISENVDTVAVAAEELSSNVREIVRNSNDIAEVSNAAVEKVTSADATIADLETHTETIGNIIKLITNVTQQTNFLALNATIEAARAGDAGRGFTVVADEIKDLSREIAQSAEDIIHNLEALQTISQDVRAANTDVSAIVVQIRDLARAIASGIQEQSATTNSISERMNESAQENKHIAGAITQIAATMRNSSRTTETVQHAARDLATLADQLQQLMDQFQV